jgi:hypothetical protein
MGTRPAGVALVLFLIPAAAYADDHWFDACGAHSAAGLSYVDGRQFTLTVPLPLLDPFPPKPKRVSLILDYSSRGGRHGDQDVNQKTWAAGLRMAKVDRVGKAVLPFGQALIVREDREGSSLDGKHTGLALGAGVEVLKRRPGIFAGVGVRLQGDVVYLFGADERSLYPRGAIGIVLRVGEY